jgi:hypothetical protein
MSKLLSYPWHYNRSNWNVLRFQVIIWKWHISVCFMRLWAGRTQKCNSEQDTAINFGTIVFYETVPFLIFLNLLQKTGSIILKFQLKKKLTYNQGCTNPDRYVAVATKVRRVAPCTCESSVTFLTPRLTTHVLRFRNMCAPLLTKFWTTNNFYLSITCNKIIFIFIIMEIC